MQTSGPIIATETVCCHAVKMTMHRISYHVLKDHLGGEPLQRDVAVWATPDELAALVETDFSSPRSPSTATGSNRLRGALDRLTEKEWPDQRPPPDAHLQRLVLR
ncbi:MAG: hypothetical protein OXK76_04350 [Gammaproteobacteria bacterium]|nr:hypothetical protein [Gammaproteobacteria bacterium]